MASKSATSWLSAREKGSALGLRFLIFTITLGGRWFVRLFLWPVSLYYVTFHGSVRRALRDYYQRLDGERPGFWKLCRHVRRFANVAVDRFFLVKGRFDLFEFTETGREHIMELTQSQCGAILLGAHIGSFEAMRALSRHSAVPLNVVGYFRNAQAFNAALEKYDPDCNVKLIEIEPGNVAFMFRIKQCIDRGELVALLGDRAGLSGQSTSVEFLGAPAEFSTGVYAMAAVLKCPVYFTVGIYREPNVYDLYCEPFAERVELPRKNRAVAQAEYAARYAERMEHFCRLAPDNWFNFYDFWAAPKNDDDAATTAARDAA